MVLRRLFLRIELIKTFRAGQIYLKKKIGKDDIRIFPKIHSIRPLPGRVEYVFTVPLGLNPADIEKKRWLFENKYGMAIELERNNKKFVLNVYDRKQSSNYRYDFAQISEAFGNKRVPILAGVNGRGELVTYDMTEHPHLLISGETGSGKSTQLRAILTALIQEKTADELQLYLCDMKQSELFLFKRVGAVKGDIITDPSDLYEVLKVIQSEMRRRGKLLADNELHHIAELSGQKEPYIVLVIDEVSMIKDEADSMAIIDEIAAIGRALGVYLVLSMQRADREVISGRLKSNLVVRMAFRASDRINSNIALGSKEAADIKVTEKGRFYLKLEATECLQGVLLESDRAKKLLEPFKVAKVQTDSSITNDLSDSPENFKDLFNWEGFNDESPR
ncbi:FtsK/SpoIIIE domain-containing protein [Fictibacillus gelatini]|uniref:FtsK/SpoIIIE domain-containing protein n=1 Tax=Fictibacillus gelatini TaxID=225985 RepID=UPI00041E5803|nr:FtsK/SpoIIIE domain-containing protein [Fictibacillus gelatini]